MKVWRTTIGVLFIHCNVVDHLNAPAFKRSLIELIRILPIVPNLVDHLRTLISQMTRKGDPGIPHDVTKISVLFRFTIKRL